MFFIFRTRATTSRKIPVKTSNLKSWTFDEILQKIKSDAYAHHRRICSGNPGAAHPAGFFHHQQFSAKAGTSATVAAAGYALDGSVAGLLRATFQVRQHSVRIMNSSEF